MPNLATTDEDLAVRVCYHAGNGGEAGFCYRPADDIAASHGTVCFRPADDDDRRGNGGRCFHAADTGSVSPCFRPDDDQPAASATDPGRPVSPCFHPEEPPVNSCRRAGDDLASDLHLALTGVEEQHLAALAVRS